MRIHVIRSSYNSDNIMSRLARELVQHPAFTLSERPDPKADLNYFVNYLELDKYPNFNATPVAAWFTHYDTGRTTKEASWHKHAPRVDMRTTSAQVYADMLRPHGLTALVTPPLNREKFQPSARRVYNETPVIGTSGFVHPGGRKGAKLLDKLRDKHPEWAFAASGRGWPVPTTLYDWENVQTFYHEIDVYVSTSVIEGIGYGPLEAMACGVPVVIPRGVGVFDELPDLENLHRYEAGDYASFEEAVTLALYRVREENGHNVESLRGATARFSTEAWINDHLRAFENFLYGAPPVPVLPDWADCAGVYYVAFGQQSRECAKRAIPSLKKHMPAVPVALVSDAPLDAGEDVFIERPDADIGGRKAKLDIYDLAPKSWQYVVYLDADTEVVADISFLFEVLASGWEMFICTNPAKYKLCSEMARPDNQHEVEETWRVMGSDEMLQLNGGVFGLRRNDRTRAFFQAWRDEWERYAGRDQPPLHRALYRNPLRLYVLGNEWNTVTRYLPAERTAGILHYPMTARRWRGQINGRLDGKEAWAAVARFDGRSE